MGRKKSNIHYIYKTTCNITGRWYVGMHSTINLDDGYIGSGTILLRSIRKYGKDNHIREILEYQLTREELVLREREIITKELISDGKCMNLKEGGDGGFSSEEHKKKFILASKKTQIQILLKDEKLRDKHNKLSSEMLKKRHAKGEVNYSTTKGRSLSEEHKKLMSEKKKGTGIGETNSQYGTCWITKDGLNKKIKKENIEVHQLEGWVKGRIKLAT